MVFKTGIEPVSSPSEEEILSVELLERLGITHISFQIAL